MLIFYVRVINILFTPIWILNTYISRNFLGQNSTHLQHYWFVIKANLGLGQPNFWFIALDTACRMYLTELIRRKISFSTLRWPLTRPAYALIVQPNLHVQYWGCQLDHKDKNSFRLIVIFIITDTFTLISDVLELITSHCIACY